MLLLRTRRLLLRSSEEVCITLLSQIKPAQGTSQSPHIAFSVLSLLSFALTPDENLGVNENITPNQVVSLALCLMSLRPIEKKSPKPYAVQCFVFRSTRAGHQKLHFHFISRSCHRKEHKIWKASRAVNCLHIPASTMRAVRMPVQPPQFACRLNKSHSAHPKTGATYQPTRYPCSPLPLYFHIFLLPTTHPNL